MSTTEVSSRERSNAVGPVRGAQNAASGRSDSVVFGAAVTQSSSMTAAPTGTASPFGSGRARWAATVQELVQLRRDEAAEEEAAEDALVDDLRRVFHDRQAASRRRRTPAPRYTPEPPYRRRLTDRATADREPRGRTVRRPPGPAQPRPDGEQSGLAPPPTGQRGHASLGGRSSGDRSTAVVIRWRSSGARIAPGAVRVRAVRGVRPGAEVDFPVRRGEPGGSGRGGCSRRISWSGVVWRWGGSRGCR